MKVLVTGATGFVGGNLVKSLLQRGDEVAVLTRRTSNTSALENLGNQVRRVTGDLRTGEGLEEAVAGVDLVHHVAGVLRARTTEEFHQGNVEGTRFLCQAMLAQKQVPRMVYCSSLAAAGPTVVGRPRTERDSPAPISVYGRSKLAAEAVVRQFAARIPSVIVRPPIVYGPGDRDNIPSFLPMARLGVFLKPSFGPKEYSVVHVQDLCDALLAAGDVGQTLDAQNPEAGVYFVSDGKNYSWVEFCDTLARSVGRSRSYTLSIPNSATYFVGLASELVSRARGVVPIMNLDKAREMREEAWTCSVDKAKREMKFEPRFQLDGGMAHTIQWFRQEGFL